MVNVNFSKIAKVTMERTGYFFCSIFPQFKRWCEAFCKMLVILTTGIPKKGIHIYYGYKRLPDSAAIAKGGLIKFQRLSKTFPNTPRRFNIIYLVSSSFPSDAERLYRFARLKKAKFVWNQDGVAYPAWMPEGWENKNSKMANLLHNADYVFYQSEFARFCANTFLGERSGPSEILYNPVDTKIFNPSTRRKDPNKLNLLVVGSHYHIYSLKSSVKTLAFLHKTIPKARLIVAGKIWDHVLRPIKKLVNDLHLEDCIELIPPFSQNKALDIFHKGDILLHSKIQDVCPGVVVEAMSCGVPVVYSLSGGVPELVGEYGGVGVATEANWEKRVSPKPEEWAGAVLKVANNLSNYGKCARQRAIEKFDLQNWKNRHRRVFGELLRESRN
jgi:glycosyltransferase involved in cell wall biosynthesis